MATAPIKEKRIKRLEKQLKKHIQQPEYYGYYELGGPPVQVEEGKFNYTVVSEPRVVFTRKGRIMAKIQTLKNTKQ